MLLRDYEYSSKGHDCEYIVQPDELCIYGIPVNYMYSFNIIGCPFHKAWHALTSSEPELSCLLYTQQIEGFLSVFRIGLIIVIMR